MRLRLVREGEERRAVPDVDMRRFQQDIARIAGRGEGDRLCLCRRQGQVFPRRQGVVGRNLDPVGGLNDKVTALRGLDHVRQRVGRRIDQNGAAVAHAGPCQQVALLLHMMLCGELDKAAVAGPQSCGRDHRPRSEIGVALGEKDRGSGVRRLQPLDTHQRSGVHPDVAARADLDPAARGSVPAGDAPARRHPHRAAGPDVDAAHVDRTRHRRRPRPRGDSAGDGDVTACP